MKSLCVSVVAIVILQVSFTASGQPTSTAVLAAGDAGQGDLQLEIKTIEVMVEQMEKMANSTEAEKEASAKIWIDLMFKRFGTVISYDTRDNLDLWVLVGRCIVSRGVLERNSPYASTPFFHIRRLRPNYQKDPKLMDLMAKLNAVRDPQGDLVVEMRYQSFLSLFKKDQTPDTQYAIGKAYDEEMGIVGIWRNPGEAVKWYEKASQAGNADALGALGDAFIAGQGGLEKDVEKGERYLLRAIDKGSASAAYKLGYFYSPNPFLDKKGDWKKGIKYYRLAAEQYYSDAISPLVNAYIEIGEGDEALRWADGGNEPDKSDFQTHMRWALARSTADRHGVCSYYKGQVYALGVGRVRQDVEKAIPFFEQSFKKGNLLAADALVAIYQEGIGLKVQPEKASQWMDKAQRMGSDEGVSQSTNRAWVVEFAKKLRASAERR